MGVGRDTITVVAKHLIKYPAGFKLIYDRARKVEKVYREKSKKEVYSSTLVHKKKEYTGFTRKKVER